MTNRSLTERFWQRVNKNGPLPRPDAIKVHPEIAGERCWIFGEDAEKRGLVWSDGRSYRPHRVAWYLETGKWPDRWVLHKCDRGGCVRFSHLFEGTVTENARDMIAKGRYRHGGGRAKLTVTQVAEIRREGAAWARAGRGHTRRRGTALLLRQIARRFGLHVQTVKKILRKEQT